MALMKMPIKICVISLIIIVSKNHYQNRKGKSPSTRRAAAPKILVLRLESLGAFRHAERQIVY